MPDNSGLKSALEKERKARRDAEAARKHDAERFAGIDPDEYAELKEAREKAEAEKAKAEGNIDELVSKRVQKALDEANKKVGDAQSAADAALKRAKAYEGRVLDDAIRAAAAKVGIHKFAVDDALFRARQMFQLDENGQAVQRDANGDVVIGKDGQHPYSPLEWLESMREKAPHWFPAAASGSGSGAPNHGGDEPSRPRSQWTVKEKAKYIEDHGRQAYEALPY